MGEKIKLILKKSFAKYFLVGIFCQSIDYLTTFFIYKYSNNVFWGNSSGYTLGTILSYILHTKFTFKYTSKKLLSIKQIIYFSISCIIGSLLGFFILKIILMNKLNFSLSKIIQLIIIAISQFLFNKKFTFNRY